MEEITLTANGLTHPALKLGNGNKLALLIHGFPDSPYTWRGIMPRLAEAGYTCIAPFLRGYSEQNTPREMFENEAATIQIADVAHDIVAMVDAAGFRNALLVGHDWGAIAAYAAANLEPQKITAVVTLSVPHLKILLSNLWKNPAQFMASWYILFFQLRFGIPESRVSRDRLDFIEMLWSRWSPEAASAAGYSETLEAAKTLLSAPQILHNALSYYRGLLTPALADLARWNESRRLSFANVRVPLLTMTGSGDGCILPEMFDGMHAAAESDFTLRILPQVGHFLTLESDERIADEILKMAKSIAGAHHA